MKGLKTTKPLKLPQRAAMRELANSRRSLADYAKLTPANSVDSVSPMIQLMRKGK